MATLTSNVTSNNNNNLSHTPNGQKLLHNAVARFGGFEGGVVR